MRFGIFIFILSGLFFFKTTYAQKLTWATPKKVEGKIIYTTILGSDERNYYLLRYDKKSKQTFLIEKYNYELRLVANYEFRIEKEISISKILYLNNKVYIFYSFYNKEKNLYELYTNILSNNLTLFNEDLYIASTNIKIPDEKLFTIKTDNLSERILVFYPDNFTKEQLTYRFTIFDPQLTEIYSNRITFENADNIKLEQVYFADTSIITITKTSYSEKPKKEKKFYILRDYDFPSNSINEYKLFYDSIIINNGIFKHDQIHNVFLFSGLYTEKNSEVQKGISFIKIFKNNDSAAIHFIPFPDNVINSIMGKIGKFEGIVNFYPRNVILRNDGGFIFICEYFDIHQEIYPSTYTFSSSYIRYYYQFKDVVIMSVDPDGKIDWTKVIRKDQVSTDDEEGYYSSFLTGVLSDKLIFLFNDLRMNSADLICYQLNPNGKVKHEILLNGNKFDGYMIPKIGYQVSNNEFLLPGFNRKRGFLLLKIFVE